MLDRILGSIRKNQVDDELREYIYLFFNYHEKINTFIRNSLEKIAKDFKSSEVLIGIESAITLYGVLPLADELMQKEKLYSDNLEQLYDIAIAAGISKGVSIRAYLIYSRFPESLYKKAGWQLQGFHEIILNKIFKDEYDMTAKEVIEELKEAGYYNSFSCKDLIADAFMMRYEREKLYNFLKERILKK